MNMKSAAVICLVLSIVVGTGRSAGSGVSEFMSNPYCYAFCGIACFAGPVECAICIENCILSAHSSPMDLKRMDNGYFCKLRCATSRCTRFLSNAQPDRKKVEGCVDSCSQTCSNTKN